LTKDDKNVILTVKEQKMTKKVETKILEFKCYRCSGFGKINDDLCPICKGTGIYKETYYYFIDGKKKIAFSGDTMK